MPNKCRLIHMYSNITVCYIAECRRERERERGREGEGEQVFSVLTFHLA